MPLKGKNITFIGLNYAPEDTAIGLYSTQMVEALLAAGAKVTVITAFPYYPHWKISNEYINQPRFLKEEIEDLTIYRYKQYVPAQPTFLKRVIHIASFTLGNLINTNKIKDTDLVVSIIPFTSSAWLGIKLSKKFNCPHWIHIQDFEFDAAMESGLSGGGKRQIFKQLFKLEKNILNQATTVSTISHKMMDKLATKTSTDRYYLPNWIDPDQINPDKASAHPYLQSDKFNLLYSGNVGEKQDWEFFLAFAKAVSNKNIDIIIVGAGAKYQELKSKVNYEFVKFYDPVALEDLSDLLCSADAHFLFQKTDVVDTVMPSKLLGMMASAKPSLVLGNPESEVKTVMEDAQAGKYLTQPDVDQAVTALESWIKNPNDTVQTGQEARKYVIHKFAREPILKKWVEQLSSTTY